MRSAHPDHLNPLLTTAGRGTNATASTAAAEVKKPPITSSVDKNAVHACLILGGWLRIEMRNTMVTRHKMGKASTSVERRIRAHNGTAGGNFGCKWLGPSAVRGIDASTDYDLIHLATASRRRGIESIWSDKKPLNQGLMRWSYCLGHS